MGTTLSVSRWIFLLTLAVVMLYSASKVDSSIVGLSCFLKSTNTTIKRIMQCYEQKPRQDCNHHAFVIRSKNGEEFCVKPTPPKLKVLLKEVRVSSQYSPSHTARAN
uniref:Chemokine interleukin-8-like domain-containing protein n=1 Tax=Anabas testudineus TaxID=64144 RepID=A0AAQ6IMH9_ANATE